MRVFGLGFTSCKACGVSATIQDAWAGSIKRLLAPFCVLHIKKQRYKLQQHVPLLLYGIVLREAQKARGARGRRYVARDERVLSCRQHGKKPIKKHCLEIKATGRL
jgi:hypothetical protein